LRVPFALIVLPAIGRQLADVPAAAVVAPAERRRLTDVPFATVVAPSGDPFVIHRARLHVFVRGLGLLSILLIVRTVAPVAVVVVPVVAIIGIDAVSRAEVVAGARVEILGQGRGIVDLAVDVMAGAPGEVLDLITVGRARRGAITVGIGIVFAVEARRRCGIGRLKMLGENWAFPDKITMPCGARRAKGRKSAGTLHDSAPRARRLPYHL